MKLKRLISWLLCVVMVVTTCAFTGIDAVAADTTGTQDEWIEVRTAWDLYNVRLNMAGKYKLMNDIDLTDYVKKGGDLDFMGNGWEPIGSNGIYSNGAFTGTFDGCGYTIKGMRIEVNALPSGFNRDVFWGLFANNAGAITNVNIEGTISNSLLSNDNGVNIHAGAIAGFNNGNISQCRNYCNIDIIAYAYAYNSSGAYNRYSYVGGITGNNDKDIYYCSNYADCTIGSTQCHISGYCDGYLGGIAGATSTNSNTYFCYNIGNLSDKKITGTYAKYDGNTYVAGIASMNSGTLYSDYNLGDIYAKDIAYGITDVGGSWCYNRGNVSTKLYSSEKAYIISKSSATRCYYLSSLSGIAVTNCKPLTEAQMRNPAYYEDFNFNGVWIIDEAVEYPYPQLRDNRQDTEKLVDTITWSAKPKKKAYYIGDEALDLTGGKFRAYYIDGTTGTVEVTPDMVSGYDLTQVGEQTVTVYYRGSELTYDITVTDRGEVNGIKLISEPDKKEFIRNTEFDFTGCKVEVSYTTGATEMVDVIAEKTTGGNITRSGKYTIVYAIGDYSVSFVVQVVPVMENGFEIVQAPTKVEYLDGEELDLTGMEVKLTFNNGNITNTDAYYVEGDASKAGNYTIKVIYENNEALYDTFDIVVSHNWNEGAVTTKPTCSKAGVRTYTCITCTATYTEDIEPTGIHSYDENGECINCDVVCNHEGHFEGTTTDNEHDGNCTVCNMVIKGNHRDVDRDYVCDLCGAQVESLYEIKQAEDGQYYYYVNGVVAEDVTAIVKYDNAFYYVLKGKVKSDANGISHVGDNWYYVKNGLVISDYTGMVNHDSSWWYVVDGVLQHEYTGFFENSAGIWYVKNGKIDVSYTGLALQDGKWLCVRNGRYYPDYTGLVQNAGAWWYCVNGVLDTTYEGAYTNDGGTWVVKAGKVNTEVTGIVKIGDDFYYATNGKLAVGYTGLVKNAGAFWYIENGILNQEYTGMFENSAGTWYVAKGKLNTIADTIVLNGVTYRLHEGKVVG